MSEPLRCNSYPGGRVTCTNCYAWCCRDFTDRLRRKFDTSRFFIVCRNRSTNWLGYPKSCRIRLLTPENRLRYRYHSFSCCAANIHWAVMTVNWHTHRLWASSMLAWISIGMAREFHLYLFSTLCCFFTETNHSLLKLSRCGFWWDNIILQYRPKYLRLNLLSARWIYMSPTPILDCAQWACDYDR